MKTFVLILSLFVLLSNCATEEKLITQYNPTLQKGCSAIVESKERLLCISKMIKQLEDIRNSKIIIADKKKNQRVNEIFVSYTTTYCFSDTKEEEKYLCFESTKDEYDPTVVGIVLDYSKKVGLGFILGVAVGVTYAP
jgi:hypothetical protein